VNTEIISIDYDECDPGDIERRAFVALEHDGATYMVRTLSVHRPSNATWLHGLSYWCLGEDKAGTQRHPAGLPDEVISAVDAELHRGQR
jgi:hypothetical protein